MRYWRWWWQHSNIITHSSRLRIWLWRARKDTGESIASRDLAQRRTTLSPVLCIFSVSWSTAVLDGAHTSTEPPVCFTSWYTMVADVTVFPVPGGPWMRDNGRCKACFRAYCWRSTGNIQSDFFIPSNKPYLLSNNAFIPCLQTTGKVP